MSGHTSGPWDVEIDKHGEVTVYESVTLQNTDICKMGGNSNGGINARLISAAPCLLEALQQIMLDIDSDHGTGYDWNKARAAIRKATGEKQ
jgi:selenophosphate synthetase-related protein